MVEGPGSRLFGWWGGLEPVGDSSAAVRGSQGEHQSPLRSQNLTASEFAYIGARLILLQLETVHAEDLSYCIFVLVFDVYFLPSKFRRPGLRMGLGQLLLGTRVPPKKEAP